MHKKDHQASYSLEPVWVDILFSWQPVAICSAL